MVCTKILSFWTAFKIVSLEEADGAKKVNEIEAVFCTFHFMFVNFKVSGMVINILHQRTSIQKKEKKNERMREVETKVRVDEQNEPVHWHQCISG